MRPLFRLRSSEAPREGLLLSDAPRSHFVDLKSDTLTFQKENKRVFELHTHTESLVRPHKKSV